MTRKPDDWMPLHIGRYLANTAHLTRDQHGAYLLILMAYWTNGGPLDAVDAQLASTARSTKKEWAMMRPVVAKFFEERDGKWHQKRADIELDRARKQVVAKSVAGKAGADARWQPHVSANSETMPAQWQTDTPLPLPKPVPKEVSKKDSSAKPPKRDFAGFWVQCPRKIGKLVAEKAYNKALQKTGHDALLEAMTRYAASRAGQDQQFTVHPATWLNQGRWMDEAPQAASGRQINPELARIQALEEEHRKAAP